MDKWFSVEIPDILPYRFQLMVQDEECGGGGIGNIGSHRHENIRFRVLRVDDSVLHDNHFHGNEVLTLEIITVLKKIVNRMLSFVDHGQKLGLILDMPLLEREHFNK